QRGQFFERRFVEMPAVLAHLECGDPVLASNIDASSRFMGFTTTQRSGIWTLAIDAGSVREIQAGFLYWGMARRPAFRFMYRRGRGDKRRAIITADDVPALGTAVAMLTRTPGSVRAPVA